jgi:diacylglycerol O-acyltransferase
MANPDRLSGLDAAFLQLERGGAHMHVASVMTFEGSPPDYDELFHSIGERLHLVPRYRQRLAEVPFGLGRPVWVDDPSFNLLYHLRHTALPHPGSDAQLAALAARIFASRLDRSKPLWEIYLVEGLAPAADGTERFALIAKTHHALVDGISGVDITAVLFSTFEEASPVGPPAAPWAPRPQPTEGELVAGVIQDRLSDPLAPVRAAGEMVSQPTRAISRLAERLEVTGSLLVSSTGAAPDTPLNRKIGSHRRYGWVNAPLELFKEIKNGLDGTINDAVLATVALGLGRWLRRRGFDTEGLVLRTMVPVSVRTADEQGNLGNQVSALWAPLPVGETDPAEAFRIVHDAMGDLKNSDQALGAETITELAGFAPPTIASQAAKLQARQRLFNLTVTNVPGPQIPLYLAGRRMTAIYPVVPLSEKTALGVAAMSYCGRLCFGLLADYDSMPDLGDVVEDFEGAMFELALAAETGRPKVPLHERHRSETAVTPGTVSFAQA